MYNVNDILKKLNHNRDMDFTVSDVTAIEEITLADIMQYSSAEIKKISEEKLTRGERKFLYQEAQQALKDNRMEEIRILSRANPQLAKAVRLAIDQSINQYSYDDLFGGRTSKFVKPGSVASMFSPAGYLTELYREARKLHNDTSEDQLDKRRPDLASLALSQENMDDELSILSLSNELLMSRIQIYEGKNYDQVMEMLSTWRLSGETPFHLPYETLRNSILLRDKTFHAFRRNPDVASGLDPVTCLALKMSIPPELLNIIIEKISEENVVELINKNFGDIDINTLQSVSALTHHYGLTYDELSTIINVLAPDFNDHDNIRIPDNQFKVLLLKLNKFVRLWRTTPLSLLDMLHVVESSSPDFTVNINTLNKLFYIDDYMNHYNLKATSALIMTDAVISKNTYGEKSSEFTYLFNSPPLSGKIFDTDNTSIDLKPGKSNDTFRTGVLKRAFQVNDAELYTLWSLANGQVSPPNFTYTIDNISVLYRVKLLASVHGLTVTELAAMLSVTSYATTSIISLDTAELVTLANYLDQYTHWLKAQNWSVGDLYLMLTKDYTTHRSPEIDNLLMTLRDGLSGQTITSDNQYRIAAPFIAAATGLDSPESAVVVLYWLDQIKPQGVTVQYFLKSLFVTAPEIHKQIAFCQVLAQLVLIVHSLQLTTAELSLAVMKPEKFQPDTQKLPHNISTIYHLAHFHNWLQQCGISATEILSALGGGTLTPAQLVKAMQLDEQLVIQGLQQTGYEAFSHWNCINITLQWVDTAKALGIMPDDVAVIMQIKYSADPMKLPSYSGWGDISRLLQVGLNPQQTEQLKDKMDEVLGTAISIYDIKNIAPKKVTVRNELYSYLLLDNQVSSQVKTTRLAEAISSVQLYVNRTLNGQEGDEVDNAVKSRQFFIDWDAYNKRYSTWAGVSLLVYYPENYVDPTMRIGQSGMMDEMLQSLSQSQLTSDTVEDAFKTYLTRFEEVANLDIISGYHDTVDINTGITWLTGYSVSDGKYYWRKVEHGKYKNGKFSANAWSDWKEIKTAINPFNNLVRPVIFNSRLYITWIERDEKLEDSSNEKHFSWKLNYSYIRHDETWSAISSVKLNSHLESSDIEFLDEISDKLRVYCSHSEKTDSMMFVFYEPQKNSESNKGTKMCGLLVNTYHDVDKNNGINKDVIWRFLDTTSEIKINTLYLSDSYKVDTISMVGNGQSDDMMTWVKNSEISNIRVEKFTDSSVTLRLNADVCVSYNDSNGSTKSIGQVKLMKKYGKIGDSFYIYKNITGTDAVYPVFTRPVNTNTGCLYMYRDKAMDVSTFKLEIPNNSVSVDVNCSKGSKYIRYLNNQPTYNSGIVRKIIIGPNNNFKTTATNANEIKTGIDPKKVKVVISYAGGKSETNAFSHINSSSLPVQHFDGTTYKFRNIDIEIPLSAFTDGKADLLISLSASSESYPGMPDGRHLGTRSGTVTITQSVGSAEALSIIRDNNNAQYLQHSVYRTRLNTLFARQLVDRANNGLSAILSMDTQLLQEPRPGEGAYVTLLLSPYDKNTHGESNEFSILRSSVYNDNDRFTLSTGRLKPRSGEKQMTAVTVFVPCISQSDNKNKIYLCAKYQSGETCAIRITRKDTQSPWYLDITYNNGTFAGLAVASVPTTQTEPMDFAGANALYFWEMFYYVPMMVFRRLQQEGKFTEATQWFKYIWSPEGYLIDGEPAPYQWNVRPLEEDTSWNTEPLDSVDPDAVAQADPMHYKVATFMGMLDLLIARGDAAYRILERDSFNEAKMWYVQALDILGNEASLPVDTRWTAPRLDDAADQTLQRQVQQAMLAVRQQVETTDMFTANSLTALFLPQQNDKLHSYWQTLAQRLYNLRHNLSIDGMPLSLPVYATPADPAVLNSAAVNQSQGGGDLPIAIMPMYRFPVILDNAKGMVNQLSQFGSNLLNLTERRDAEALSEMLQLQGTEIARQSIAMQEKNISELDADKSALEMSRSGAQSRLDSYTQLYDEDINTGEKQVMDLSLAASVLSTTATTAYTVGAALDMVPNIYGMAFGGSRYGALARAIGSGIEVYASATRIAADRISQSEAYRRRRQEWNIQRNNAEAEVKQINAQLEALTVRREAAVMQKTYLETQQAQTQAQLTYLQNKFSNKALYSWLRGKLSAIYYQFYDLAVSRCLMAQEAYKWSLGDNKANFIRPGAWQGTNAGLMAGETLTLNLAQMEHGYLQKDTREKDVVRTVCLSEIYAGLGNDSAFVLTDKMTELVNKGGSAGSDDNTLKVDSSQLLASLKLSDLKIGEDYPGSLGKIRRIKQISVTLPALTAPYQDVRAVLSYGGSTVVPRGCEAIAVSHGMNDSGQFQLDFNDHRWLPFEGIPVDDQGTLTLTFPDATDDDGQKALLLSLSDIILHIRYTIR
jgi:hypothetical protein